MSRALKELRSLAPWNWDSRVAKHPPGEKALRDFEKIESVFLPGGGQRNPDSALKDVSGTPGPASGLRERRRSTYSATPNVESWSTPATRSRRSGSADRSRTHHAKRKFDMHSSDPRAPPTPLPTPYDAAVLAAADAAPGTTITAGATAHKQQPSREDLLEPSDHGFDPDHDADPHQDQHPSDGPLLGALTSSRSTRQGAATSSLPTTSTEPTIGGGPSANPPTPLQPSPSPGPCPGPAAAGMEPLPLPTPSAPTPEAVPGARGEHVAMPPPPPRLTPPPSQGHVRVRGPGPADVHDQHHQPVAATMRASSPEPAADRAAAATQRQPCAEHAEALAVPAAAALKSPGAAAPQGVLSRHATAIKLVPTTTGRFILHGLTVEGVSSAQPRQRGNSGSACNAAAAIATSTPHVPGQQAALGGVPYTVGCGYGHGMEHGEDFNPQPGGATGMPAAAANGPASAGAAPTAAPASAALGGGKDSLERSSPSKPPASSILGSPRHNAAAPAAATAAAVAVAGAAARTPLAAKQAAGPRQVAGATGATHPPRNGAGTGGAAGAAVRGAGSVSCVGVSAGGAAVQAALPGQEKAAADVGRAQELSGNAGKASRQRAPAAVLPQVRAREDEKAAQGGAVEGEAPPGELDSGVAARPAKRRAVGGQAFEGSRPTPAAVGAGPAAAPTTTGADAAPTTTGADATAGAAALNQPGAAAGAQPSMASSEHGGKRAASAGPGAADAEAAPGAGAAAAATPALTQHQLLVLHRMLCHFRAAGCSHPAAMAPAELVSAIAGFCKASSVPPTPANIQTLASWLAALMALEKQPPPPQEQEQPRAEEQQEQFQDQQSAPTEQQQQPSGQMPEPRPAADAEEHHMATEAPAAQQGPMTEMQQSGQAQGQQQAQEAHAGAVTAPAAAAPVEGRACVSPMPQEVQQAAAAPDGHANAQLPMQQEPRAEVPQSAPHYQQQQQAPAVVLAPASMLLHPSMAALQLPVAPLVLPSHAAGPTPLAVMEEEWNALLHPSVTALAAMLQRSVAVLDAAAARQHQQQLVQEQQQQPVTAWQAQATQDLQVGGATAYNMSDAVAAGAPPSRGGSRSSSRAVSPAPQPEPLASGLAAAPQPAPRAASPAAPFASAPGAQQAALPMQHRPQGPQPAPAGLVAGQAAAAPPPTVSAWEPHHPHHHVAHACTYPGYPAHGPYPAAHHHAPHYHPYQQPYSHQSHPYYPAPHPHAYHHPHAHEPALLQPSPAPVTRATSPYASAAAGPIAVHAPPAPSVPASTAVPAAGPLAASPLLPVQRPQWPAGAHVSERGVTACAGAAYTTTRAPAGVAGVAGAGAVGVGGSGARDQGAVGTVPLKLRAKMIAAAGLGQGQGREAAWGMATQ